MNLKVQFGKSVHKLNKDINSLQDIIKFVYSVYKDKVPQYFDFQYEDEGETGIITNDEDLKIAREECAKKKKGLKLLIVEGNENDCELMLQSFIQAHKDEQQQNKMGEPIENSQIIKEDGQQELQDLNNILGDLNNEKQVEEKKEDNQDKVENKMEQQQDAKIINEEKIVQFDQQVDQQKIEQEIQEKEDQSQNKQEPYQNDIEKNLDNLQQNYIKEVNSMKNEQLPQKDEDNIKEIQPKLEQQYQPDMLFSSLIQFEKVPENAKLIQIFEQVVERKLLQYGLIKEEWLLQKYSVQQKFIDKEEIKQEEQIQNKPVMGDSAMIKSILKRYKAQLFKDPLSLFVVPAGSKQLINWNVQLRNNGDQHWPQNTRFYQISPELKEFLVNEQQDCMNRYPEGVNNFEIQYKVPTVPVTEMIHWRLGYEENNQIKYFGPKVTFELKVQKNQGEQSQKINQGSSVQVMQIQQQEKKIEKPVDKQTLEKAKQMAEFLSGDVQIYIDFIQKSQLANYPMDQLVDMYMQSQQF